MVNKTGQEVWDEVCAGSEQGEQGQEGHRTGDGTDDVSDRAADGILHTDTDGCSQPCHRRDGPSALIAEGCGL